jgi:hypothetical protein
MRMLQKIRTGFVHQAVRVLWRAILVEMPNLHLPSMSSLYGFFADRFSTDAYEQDAIRAHGKTLVD